jgi:hypothetical protein
MYFLAVFLIPNEVMFTLRNVSTTDIRISVLCLTALWFFKTESAFCVVCCIVRDWILYYIHSEWSSPNGHIFHVRRFLDCIYELHIDYICTCITKATRIQTPYLLYWNISQETASCFVCSTALTLHCIQRTLCLNWGAGFIVVFSGMNRRNPIPWSNRNESSLWISSSTRMSRVKISFFYGYKDETIPSTFTSAVTGNMGAPREVVRSGNFTLHSTSKNISPLTCTIGKLNLGINDSTSSMSVSLSVSTSLLPLSVTSYIHT